jgi:hypothetical protein
MRDQLRVARNRGRLALDFIFRSGLMGKPYSGTLGTVGIGPTTMEELVDEYALRMRAERAAADPTAAPVNGPLTDDERRAAREYIDSYAEDDSFDGSE